MTTNKEKQFDCIKMKTDVQAQIYAETQHMSTQELLDYFNKNKLPYLDEAGVYLETEKARVMRG
jgi:hypothetical protein